MGGVVHLVGGTGAFVLAWIIGARDGLLLLTGWFGFNGGSSLGASGGYAMEGARVCAVTAIAAAAGGMNVLLYVWFTSHFIYMWASQTMLNYQIDDPLDAAPIHGVCGVWGLLAVGLFANGTYGYIGVFYIS